MGNNHRQHTISVKDSVVSFFDFLRWRGSVLPAIFPQVFISTFIACIVYYTDANVAPIAFSSSVLPTISIVVGMCLAFRTNSAYDRFYEGRQLWSDIKSQSRNLMRYLLLFIPNQKNDVNGSNDKTTAIRLVAAYMYSCKALLREELVSANLDSDLEFLLPESLKNGYKHAISQHVSSNDRLFDQLLPHVTSSQVFFGKGKQLPAAILLKLNEILQEKAAEGVIDEQCLSFMTQIFVPLSSSLASLERIAETPVPLAYTLHLSHSLWLYFFFLPFTLVDTAHFWCILVQLVVSFTLFGVTAIGAEIENPFGYDENDLPLDSICSEFREEMASLTSRF